jgi:hypothetical protein
VFFSSFSTTINVLSFNVIGSNSAIKTRWRNEMAQSEKTTSGKKDHVLPFPRPIDVSFIFISL